MADPQSLCDRYSSATYARMKADEARTGAYAAAIQRSVSGRVCLDIGSGALALLAVMAAKAGAARVYAVEANVEAFAAARRTVEAEGLTDRITLIHGYSTSIGALPEPVDVLLHEIIGELAGSEGVVRVLLDARRHARPAALSIPAAAASLLAPCEFPPHEYFAALPHPMLSSPAATALKLPQLPLAAISLAPPQRFEQLDFGEGGPEPSQRRELRFVAARRGVLRGACVHVELRLLDAEATDADVSSAREGSHWPNVLLLLPEEHPVEEGEAIVVATHAELAGEQPRYEFEFFVEEPSATSGEVAAGADASATRRRPLGKIYYPD
ncbi:hypothetical protein AB1Y20_001801 [Prymnesium parvum]|uniref:Protein arginine N-methyltransferase n=1 Tax=Prymnesium parvum TaxID=97485 RepID=A0AB34K971_PRYPA